MANAISISPRATCPDFPLRLGNGAELGARGEFPSHGAQIRVRDCPIGFRLAVPASRSSFCSSRNSTTRVLAAGSEGSEGQGFGRAAGVWSGNELRERRRDNIGGRGSREWQQEKNNRISVCLGGQNGLSEKPASCGSTDDKAAAAEGFNAGGTGAFGSRSGSTKSPSVGVMLGGVLLALGFMGLRFCKPAYAEPVVAPPTLSAPLDANREAEVSEAKYSETERVVSEDVVVPEEGMKVEERSGGKESGGEGFEPAVGEGSDVANDPAEVLLKSYLETHPVDEKALQALLFLRLNKGEVNEVGPVLTKLIELDPDNIEWKYIRAQADEYAGDLVQARRGFEEILQSKPLSARAWQGLAVIMHETGEDEEALEKVMEAVNTAVDAGQSKEALNLRMLLGQLHTMQGNLEKAMELYKVVVEEDPQDYRPYLCQGLVYSMIGEEAEAEKYFRRYRKLCPKDFPQRGDLDELLLRAKSESGKLKQDEELKTKGNKAPKVIRQPLASGGEGNPSLDNQNTT